jgi:transcriptional regulator with XRE-family HTH domain
MSCPLARSPLERSAVRPYTKRESTAWARTGTQLLVADLLTSVSAWQSVPNRMLRMKIGSHLRSKREELGLSQAELAKELRVTRQHVSRIELERAAPTLALLLKLSRQLGVSTDWLLTGRETADPADAADTIRADPGMSPAAKRHLIGIIQELRN